MPDPIQNPPRKSAILWVELLPYRPAFDPFAPAGSSALPVPTPADVRALLDPNTD